MTRNDVTEKIISTKVAKGLQWSAIAQALGRSKEWSTALCLGQMTATAEQASVVSCLNCRLMVPLAGRSARRADES